MNQHTFVQERLAYYEEQGLVPGNPEDGNWDECHYPKPKWAGGTETILMLHNDHQQQGLYQSEEYQRPCFYNPDVKRFLDNNWCPNWFEIYEVYDKWKGVYATGVPKETLLACASVMNEHENTIKNRSELGKVTSVAMNAHKNTLEQQKVNGRANGPANARTINSQKWECTITGYVSNPGGLTKYQRARGIDTSLRVKLQD